MINLQDVRKWLTGKYSDWRNSRESLSIMENMENTIGAVALWSIMLLIKIQHIKYGGGKYDPIMRMDGNADNWHELSDYEPPTSEHSYLDMQFKSILETASILLKYGS